LAIQIRLSGGQNNASPIGSLGGQRSDTSVVTDTDQNFFDNITRTEGLIGKTEYRCGYVWNPDATTATGVIIELSTNPALTQVSIGLDPVGKGDGRTTAIAQTIATEDTVPSGVRFFGEENPDDGAWDTVKLPLGILRQNEGVPFWLKRKTEQGAAQTITFNLDVVHDATSLTGETYDDGGAFGELLRATTTASGQFQIGTARVDFSDVG
jgi:hypothetical protein